MRVFVTGATGLLGSHIAARLLARGDEVTALVRSPARGGFLRERGARLVEGELSTPVAGLSAAMSGHDAVVHAAAIVYRNVSARVYQGVNVAGTERILEAAAAAGVARAIHISSVAVYGSVRRPVDEAEWLAHEVEPHNIYAATKRAAEEAAWRLHDAGRIAVTAIRPGVIYGERDRLFTPLLASLLRARVAPLPAGGHHTVPVVYAGNVAAGVIAALDTPGSAGRAYALSGDAGLTARGLVEHFAAGLGRRVWIVPVPSAAVHGVATAWDAARRILPAAAATGLKRAAWLMTNDNPYATARAERELGWGDLCEPYPAALRRTAAWHRANPGRT